MKLSQFRFNLPKELIAEKPVRNRDEARMMVVHRDSGEIEHRVFKEFINYVDEGDVVVANNTKVFPALLDGEKEKTGAKIEVLLLRELNEDMCLWDVIVDPARKIRIGNKLYFGTNDALVAEVVDNTTSRGRTIRFLFDGPHSEFIKIVKSMGRTPLPDELRRKRMEIKDVLWKELTVHCGMGEFKNIEVEDLSKHRADAEEMHLSEDVCNAIEAAKDKGKHVCAVGTTTMRALESAVTIPGKVFPYDGWTNKFIFPPYEFTIADMMVTNFHHPMSTQFIMVSAFLGPELAMQAYQTAIKEKYRFSTYGDAMLIV